LIQHGIGRNGQFWSYLVPWLTAHFTVLRRDLPGHGLSPDPGKAYQWTVEGEVDSLAGFLEEVAGGPLHYLGESTGGILGATLASRRPDLFESLTLCATPIKPPAGGSPTLEDASSVIAREGSLEWVRSMIDARVLSGQGQGHRQWAEEQSGVIPRHVLAALTKLAATVDLTSLLADITVPTLVLAPANSPVTSLKEQVELRRRIPGARIAVIDARSHEIYVDEPEACLTQLLKFYRLSGFTL
jgi:pimeloyl-ACP methyl ester carboxylesterase